MSRINTNVSSLIAQRVLGQNNGALTTSLERLSTGLRINRGKDDPAGLIASQNLRAESASLGAAISNAERADQVVNIAEGGLNEVSGLLTDLQSLVTQTANTAGLSREEKEANQLQIDSILQTIDRISSATSFQGAKLLNGNFDYSTSGVSSSLTQFRVFGAKLAYNGSLDVDVLVTASAQVGGFLMSFGGAALDLGSADEQFVVEIAGAKGARELSFASGTSTSDIVATINSFSEVTGVRARVSGADGAVRLFSSGYGADEFVSVRVVDDGGLAAGDGILNLATGNADAVGAVAATFAQAANRITDYGQDVQATINGIVATTRGTTARINTDFLDVEVDLQYDTGVSAGPNAAQLGVVDAFKITGGGADFQLAGRVDIAGKVSVGVQNIAVRDLGRSVLNVLNSSGTAVDSTFTLSDLSAGRELNLKDGNLGAAQSVVEKAIREVSAVRGRLGAFQSNTVAATIRSLGIALENTTSAESVIRDSDFASETSSLTRAQILVSSAQNTLALANAQPQSALQLLG
jgi:flagellin